MNLWVRKKGLVILSALALFSCEEELSTVGLPPQNDLGISYVDVPLKDHVSQVWINNVNSRATGGILVGSYQDEYFGMIEAQNFSELTLPSRDPGAGLSENAAFDSLVLEARMRRIYGQDVEGVTQKINIYQLADTIHAGGNRITTASSQELGQKLAESEFMLYPDSLDFDFADTGRDENMDHADSVYREKFFDSEGNYIYKSTFRIDDAFAQDFYTKMKNSDPAFDSLGSFSNYMKGLAFTPDPGNNAVITYESADTELVLYYTETADDGTTSQKSLSFSVVSGLSYNNIKPNKNSGWNGSAFDQITTFYEPYETAGDMAYIQSGTNLLLKLDLSIFNEFNDTTENAVIQNANLFFDNIAGVTETTPPPQTMTYYLTSSDSLANENYRVRALRDNNGTPFRVTYNEEANQVKTDITLSLQNLLSTEDYNQLILAPVLIRSDGFTSADASGVNRLVMPKENISIRLYYTIPDKNN